MTEAQVTQIPRNETMEGRIQNQEAVFSYFLARVVENNETFKNHFRQEKGSAKHQLPFRHNNPAYKQLRISMALGKINKFEDLTLYIDSKQIGPDIKSGIGRQIFRAVNAMRHSAFSPRPDLLEKADRWMEDTFGIDRIDRYRRELQGNNPAIEFSS